MLDRDLEEAEEQYSLAVRSHMLVVDNLLDLQVRCEVYGSIGDCGRHDDHQLAARATMLRPAAAECCTVCWRPILRFVIARHSLPVHSRLHAPLTPTYSSSTDSIMIRIAANDDHQPFRQHC
jgi:hypothetical protein